MTLQDMMDLVAGYGTRMALRPEQQSVMPGVNETQARENLAAIPKVDPETLNKIISYMPFGGMAKVFKPSSVGTVEDLLQTLVRQGEPLRRQSLLPAVQLKTGEVVKGGLGSGHGNVYEALTPYQMKGMVDGYVPASYPEVFLNRDQGTVASGSLEGIQRLLDNLLHK